MVKSFCITNKFKFMKKIDIKKISKNNCPYLIAEIGVNHNGSIYIAKKLIDLAQKAGFDAVKFQTYNLDGLLKKNTHTTDYQLNKSKNKNMYQLLKKYILSYDQFLILSNYCKDKKITFLSTPFDIESAIFLNKINIPAFKISSSDNDNYLLLDQIKKFKKPIILSTGMSTNFEINKTIKYLKLSKSKLSILHCVSEYPTKLINSKIYNIKNLKKFGYCCGLSDHTEGIESSIASISLGVKIIEKHITLDKKMEGPDHSASLEARNLNEYVKKIKDISKSLIERSDRNLSNEEKKIKSLAKKALYFNRACQKGEKITTNDIIALRPRLNGIPPSDLKKIIGKKIKQDTKKNQIITSSIIY